MRNDMKDIYRHAPNATMLIRETRDHARNLDRCAAQIRRVANKEEDENLHAIADQLITKSQQFTEAADAAEDRIRWEIANPDRPHTTYTPEEWHLIAEECEL